jgi:FtsZ-binding cell division protein ZapB
MMKDVFEQLSVKQQKAADMLETLDDLIKNKEDGNADKDEAISVRTAYEAYKKQLEKATEEAGKWATTMVVIGFNSSRYDLKLVRTPLIKALEQYDGEYGFVARNQGGYPVLERLTAEFGLRFIDVANFVAAGTSYAKFLEAFNTESGRKSFFCYEYVTSFEKLQEEGLPPPESFYSSVKGKNVLEEGFVPDLNLGEDENERQRQRVITDNYAKLQHVWEAEGMRTLGDLLVYYTNLDTGPMVEACLKQSKFYREQMDIDCYKDAISVPGIARSLLMKSVQDTNTETFSRFSSRMKTCTGRSRKTSLVRC